MDLNNLLQTSDNSVTTITLSSAVSGFLIALVLLLQRLLPKISDRILAHVENEAKKESNEIKKESVELTVVEKENALSQRAKEQLIDYAEQHIKTITQTQSDEIKSQAQKIELLNERHNELYRQHVEIVASDKMKEERIQTLHRNFAIYRKQMTKAFEASNLEMDKMRNEIIVLRQQVDILTRRSSELEKLNDVLETSLRESRKEINVKDGIIHQLEEKVRNMERQIIEMQMKVNSTIQPIRSEGQCI